MRLPFGLRWWELAPEVVLAVGLGIFFVTETSAATSAFHSSTAIALMAAVSVGWLVARIVLVRWGRWPAVRLVVFGAAALAVLKVVVLPAYDDTTVVETLPVAAEVIASTTTTTVPQVAVPPVTVPVDTVPPPTSPPTTAVPAGPELLRSGAIGGIGHRASGTAALYRQPGGAFLVGLEGIDIQPGPDYDVYVVAGADRQDIGGGIRLDDLRGNKGTQYYDVPAGTDLTAGEWTVLVWCQTFDVPVASATPA
jgi:hypothetical protein